jgi:hypothetical protein
MGSMLFSSGSLSRIAQLAQNMVSTQPMTAPSSLVFYMDFQYKRKVEVFETIIVKGL